jgi:hypothetical protein
MLVDFNNIMKAVHDAKTLEDTKAELVKLAPILAETFAKATQEAEKIADLDLAKAQSVSLDAIHYLASALKAMDKGESAQAKEQIVNAMTEFLRMSAMHFKVVVPNNQHPVIKIEKQADGTLSFDMNIPIVKVSSEDERMIYGIVYEPDIVDAQGDSASANEIKKACHKFMMESGVIGIMHKKEAGDAVTIVENFIAPISYIEGGQTIRKGTWMMGLKVKDDTLWADVKAKKITGLSMGGRARAGN